MLVKDGWGKCVLIPFFSRKLVVKFESFWHFLPHVIQSYLKIKCIRLHWMILLITLHLQVGENWRRRRFEWCVCLDEHALVTALKEMGVVFFNRTPDSVLISFVNKFDFIFSISNPFFLARWRRKIWNFKCIRIHQVEYRIHLIKINPVFSVIENEWVWLSDHPKMK
jgi:hypothetical protein